MRKAASALLGLAIALSPSAALADAEICEMAAQRAVTLAVETVAKDQGISVEMVRMVMAMGGMTEEALRAQLVAQWSAKDDGGLSCSVLLLLPDSVIVSAVRIGIERSR